MKELDEADMEKSLREKLASYGRQPSDKVWENIEQRVAGHRKPTAKFKPWLLPLFIIVGGSLLMLIGNLLPSVYDRSETIAPQSRPVTVTSAEKPATPTSAANATAAPEFAAGNHTEARASANPATGKNTAVISQNLKSGNVRQAPADIKNKAATTEKLITATAGKNQPSNEIPATVPAEIQTVGNLVSEPAAPIATGSKSGYTDNTEHPEALAKLIILETSLQKGLAAASPEFSDRNQLMETIQAEKAELAALQQRADSMLAALGEYVPENMPGMAKKDTSTTKKPRSRWSVALAFAPERNFLSFKSAENDPLMERRSNHETGSNGFNAFATVDYKLTEKLSISSGFGYSTYSAELRLTNVETVLESSFDTITVTTGTSQTSTNTITSVHENPVLQLIPVLNGSGQVIAYDSIYTIINDTTYFTIEHTDSIKNTTQTINQNVTKKETTTYKVLKPNYHFVTLPVMLRYRLTPGARWWADVAFGAQLQWFRGGTQVVTEDGRNFRTEKIKASEGPFRQFNMALIGNLALNYGLTEKLSVSAAPALRYQVQSVFKSETGLKQKPVATGLQFGLRYQF